MPDLTQLTRTSVLLVPVPVIAEAAFARGAVRNLLLLIDHLKSFVFLRSVSGRQPLKAAAALSLARAGNRARRRVVMHGQCPTIWAVSHYTVLGRSVAARSRWRLSKRSSAPSGGRSWTAPRYGCLGRPDSASERCGFTRVPVTRTCGLCCVRAATDRGRLRLQAHRAAVSAR